MHYEKIDTQERTSAPKGKLKYISKCVPVGSTELRCTFETQDKCDRLTVEIIENYITIEKSTSTWAKILEWSSAGIALGVGTLITVDASYLPPDDDPLNTNPIGKTGAYLIGAGVLAVGASLLTMAIVDSVRAIDEVKDSYTVENVVHTEEFDCDRRPLANRQLEASIEKKRVITTDENGVALVDIRTLVKRDSIVEGTARPVVLFSDSGKVFHKAGVKYFWDKIIARERKRRQKEAERLRKISETNVEIAKLVETGNGASCLAWVDSNPRVVEGESKFIRVKELKNCAADGIAEYAGELFSINDFDGGTEQIKRIEKLFPNHESLSELEVAQRKAFANLIARHLMDWRPVEAKKLQNRCLDTIREVAACEETGKKVEKSDAIFAVSNMSVSGLIGALVVIGEEKAIQKELRNLQKRVVLRSGGFKDLEWVPASRVNDVLPQDDTDWQKECLSDDSCSIGILKQVQANVLIGIVLEQQDAKRSFKAILIQPVGGILDRTTLEFEGTPKAVRKETWSKIDALLHLAIRNRDDSQKAKKKAQLLARSKESPGEDSTISPWETETAMRDKSSSTRTQRPSAPRAGLGPYSSVDMASLFATDEDVHPPPTCVDIFKESHARPPRTEEDGGAVFVKPNVLLLDLRRAPSGAFNMTDEILATQGLKHTLMNTFRMKRNNYIVPCQKVTLEDIRGKKLYGVEFVFSLAINKWEEDRGEESGKLMFVETEFSLDIWDLREGDWKVYGDVDVSVPSYLDKAVFLAEDAKNAAVEEALKQAGDLKKGIEKAVDFAKEGMGGAKTVKLGNEVKDWYVYKVKQSLKMAGKKLGVEVAHYQDFRLRSPVLSREDDEVGIGVGDSEGVRRNDTFLFTRKGPDEWEGFGRISHVGAGGELGRQDQSEVEVIADYDGPEEGMQALEYPVIGIMAGLSLGLLPYSHDRLALDSGEIMNENPIGMFGVAVDFRWRIPWIPLCELYQTNRISFPIDAPLFIMTIDPGFEKRWFWGRFAPVLGIRYSLGIVGVPTNNPGNADETVFAIGITHGMEGYTGFNIFAHPAVTISMQAGWRYFFSELSSFSYEDFNIQFTKSGGGRWGIDLSGPFALLGVTYEY